ncbi:MAG: DUF1934 domain-containing protein [Candidatus Cohnella colombiensis]|uniref:DUF1934 domain-containing protein n=1 Tax=Candidatus Cohnella colombiensis TaxID=3121368 RepID=A0AA95EW00_9BACL|nr:MAG: DUF1934 domain-containing protein [Cohnella sp.]
MPDKRNVTVGFTSWQQGEKQRSKLRGQLYKLQTGWTLIYVEPAVEDSVETRNTLFIYDDALKLRRQGAVGLEVNFRQGATLSGQLTLPNGSQTIETLTHQLHIELSAFGGVIDWKYDLLMQEQSVGSFQIRLDIQEEQAQ